MTGGFSQELAEVVVVDRVFEAIGLSGLFEVGNRKNGGAEDLLGLRTFFCGNAQMTGEFEIDQ
jgi:hypothetical protein